MVSRMVARCCIRCAKLICAVRTGSILPKDSFVTRFTNSTCSLSTSAHLNCTAATSGNAFGRNRAPSRVHKSVTKAELGDGSFQHVSQPHSQPVMCTSVSRRERKLSIVGSHGMNGAMVFRTWLYSKFNATAWADWSGRGPSEEEYGNVEWMVAVNDLPGLMRSLLTTSSRP